jgi:hypothetical protein
MNVSSASYPLKILHLKLDNIQTRTARQIFMKRQETKGRTEFRRHIQETEGSIEDSDS